MKKMQKLMLMLIKFQEKELKKNEADGMIFQTETQLKRVRNYLMKQSSCRICID
jgi:hypothetical protein